MLAYSRPFLPLFLHVGGAMVLFGAVGAAALLSFAGSRSESRSLARSAFLALLTTAIPAWIVFRAGAQWIYSKEGFGAVGATDPTWLGIGFAVSDAGLIVLLAATGVAFWWTRRGTARLGRVVAGLTTLQLVLITVGWLAMSGKWS